MTINSQAKKSVAFGYPRTMLLGAGLLAMIGIDGGTVTSMARAQDTGDPMEGIATICMAREDTPVAIVVPATDVGALEHKGFSVRPCGRAFASQAEQLKWRDRICDYTSRMNDEMQDQFERVHGERPAVLCGMAELALGQWDRNDTEQR